MKYLHLILISGFILISSCSKKPEDILAKEWGLSDMQMEIIDPKMKEMFEGLKDEMNKQKEDMKKDFFFNFNKDGSYVTNGGKKGMEEKGKWSIVNGNTLVTKSDGKEIPDSIHIQSMEDAKIILVAGDQMSKVTLTLTKK